MSTKLRSSTHFDTVDTMRVIGEGMAFKQHKNTDIPVVSYLFFYRQILYFTLRKIILHFYIKAYIA